KAAKLIAVPSNLTTAAAVANASYQAGKTTYTWINDYVTNFPQVTSAAIAADIDRRFSPNAARWVKEQYALVHLSLLAEDDATRTGLATLSAASGLANATGLDPLGISGVVSAFAKPICSTDDPLPQVSPRY